MSTRGSANAALARRTVAQKPLGSGTASVADFAAAATGALKLYWRISWLVLIAAVCGTPTAFAQSPPILEEQFGAASAVIDGSATLVFVVFNPNPSTLLSGLGFTDTLPPGLVISTPNGLANGCPGTVTAPAGGQAISFLNGVLPQSASCNIMISVTATTIGNKTNTTSTITSGQSAAGGAATATLYVGPNIHEYPIPTANSLPFSIVAGSDGALWFTEGAGRKIGRITTAGIFTTEFPMTNTPNQIAAGPDGALWFTEGANNIGRITTSGVFTEYPIPTADSALIGIAAGADGALWFVEQIGNKIGRITTSGVVTEYPVPTANSQPYLIAPGPDGALWFTELAGNKIGRITTSGVIAEYPVPTVGSEPDSIAAGPDGALWFTELAGNKIGRITTSGSITEYPVPTANAEPQAIAAGRDGALWFTEINSSKIGRITISGLISEYPLPTAGSGPTGIVVGTDGALWFVEQNANNIGRIPEQPAVATHDLSRDGKSDIVWRDGSGDLDSGW